jgi:hypothetical protein
MSVNEKIKMNAKACACVVCFATAGIADRFTADAPLCDPPPACWSKIRGGADPPWSAHFDLDPPVVTSGGTAIPTAAHRTVWTAEF